MVDGEAVEMTIAMIPFDSPSRQGARTKTAGPELGFTMAAAYGGVLRKSGYPQAFLGQRGLVAARGSRGGGRGGHTTSWRDQMGPAPRGGVGPSGLFSVWSS